MKKKKLVEMLWTAGMDSTYRLVQLSRIDGIEVQPYYVKSERKSKEYELDRISKIYDILVKREETKATILKPIIIDKADIPVDKDIVVAHVNFYKHTKLGSQYKYLGSFAKDHPGLELSIERDEDEDWAFQKKGIQLNPVETEIGIKHVVDKDKDPDAYVIFKDFTFPIATSTKADEVNFFKDNGYEDIMNLTWFCHNPKKGEPCGYCTPCIQYVGDGLGFKLGEKGLKRYKYRAILGFPMRTKVFFERLSSRIFKKK